MRRAGIGAQIPDNCRDSFKNWLRLCTKRLTTVCLECRHARLTVINIELRG